MAKSLLIATIFLLTLIFGVNSDKYEINLQDLKQLEAALRESFKYMEAEVKDEDVAICIGGTKSGKSTLINYLIGNKLKAEKIPRSHSIAISKVDSRSVGPEIGVGATSKTTIPTRWVSLSLLNLTLWDAPGFDDNRGSIQDITNAFYIYQLLQNVRTLKIVLVVDVNDILHDNIKPFLLVLSAVESLFGRSVTNCFTSISVVFTKVPYTLYDEVVDKNFISDILSNKLLSNNTMDVSTPSKDFVRFLVENNDRMAIFKRAKEGLVTSALDVDIFSSIKNSTYIDKATLKEINPTIATSSKLFLFQTREKLISKTAFSGVEDAINRVCNSKVDALLNITNGEENKDQINAIYNELNVTQNNLYSVINENDFVAKLETLQEIDATFNTYIKDNNLMEKMKLMKFIDKLLGLQESEVLLNKLQIVLSTSHSNVSQAISIAQFKLSEITQEEYDKKIREEQELNEKIKKELEDYIRKKEEENERIRQTFITLFAGAASVGGAIAIFG